MLQFGVIGLGNIAHRFCESLMHFDEANFYAGGSRSIEKQEEFKKLYNPDKLYSSYDELLDDPEIDVVYIALPHGFHYEWIMKSLHKGKCVLCEKPAVLTKDQIIEITNLAKEKHLFFMEAMKARFIPMINVIHEEINKGTIGDIISVENHFNYAYDGPHSYLFDKKQGGALYDVGCYCIATALDFIRSDIENVDVKAVLKDDVDVHTNIEITFVDGKKAYLEGAIDEPNNRRDMIIKGTKGTISFSPFYRPTECLVELNNGESFTGTKDYLFDDFHPEIQAVIDGISYVNIEHPRMTHQDSIKYISLMEDIYKKIHE